MDAPVFSFLEEWAGRSTNPGPSGHSDTTEKSSGHVESSTDTRKVQSVDNMVDGAASAGQDGASKEDEDNVDDVMATEVQIGDGDESVRHADSPHCSDVEDAEAMSDESADDESSGSSKSAPLACNFCNASDDSDQFAVCSVASCCKAYHVYCLQPPLRRVPRQWQCSACTSGASRRIFTSRGPTPKSHKRSDSTFSQSKSRKETIKKPRLSRSEPINVTTSGI